MNPDVGLDLENHVTAAYFQNLQQVTQTFFFWGFSTAWCNSRHKGSRETQAESSCGTVFITTAVYTAYIHNGTLNDSILNNQQSYRIIHHHLM